MWKPRPDDGGEDDGEDEWAGKKRRRRGLLQDSSDVSIDWDVIEAESVKEKPFDPAVYTDLSNDVNFKWWWDPVTDAEINKHMAGNPFVPGSCPALRPVANATTTAAGANANTTKPSSGKAVIGWYDYFFEFGSMDPEVFEIEVEEAEIEGDFVDDDWCGDYYYECADWAAAGECETNAGFMSEECKMSCGGCSSSPPSKKKRRQLLQTVADDDDSQYETAEEMQWPTQCSNIFTGEIKCWDDCKPIMCDKTDYQWLDFKWQIKYYENFDVCAADHAKFYCCNGQTEASLEAIGKVTVPPSPLIHASLSYENSGMDGGKVTGASVTMMFISVVEYEGSAQFSRNQSKQVSEIIIGRASVMGVTTHNIDPAGGSDQGVFKKVTLESRGTVPAGKTAGADTITAAAANDFIFRMECFVGTNDFNRTDIKMKIHIDESKCDITLLHYPKKSNTSSLALKTAVMAEKYEESFTYEMEDYGDEVSGEETSQNVKLQGSKLDFKQGRPHTYSLLGVFLFFFFWFFWFFFSLDMLRLNCGTRVLSPHQSTHTSFRHWLVVVRDETG